MTVHFIATGGSVMHQLAIALKNKGYQVSGSDDEIFEPARSNLEKAGLLPPAIGWDAARVHPGIDAVILGMHAREDNPELQKARQLELKIYSFPEYIYQESRNKIRVVVGGSHGKTTITSMIMHVLKDCGKEFDYLVGARLDGFEQSVKITDAPLIVCEGDEYPASAIEKRPKFHFFHPHIAILSGIAWDHINVFPTFENYKEQFAIFIREIEKEGCLIYNHTDKVLRETVDANAKDIRLLPYELPAFSINNDITTVRFGGLSTALEVFGEHNLLNVQAAKSACNQLGIDDESFLKSISRFRGAAKRMELVGKNDRCAIYRDFAHAPSKVKATIPALKHQYPRRKLISVLELHTYSSLNAKFLSEYAGAMDDTDIAAVFFSRHALELKRLPELPPALIREGFRRDDLYVFSQLADLQSFLDQQDYRDTNLLLMSSGNYDGMDLNRLKQYLKEE